MFRQDLSQAFTRTMGCGGSELADWLQRALPDASLAPRRIELLCVPPCHRRRLLR